jgi:hypothetical protein
MFSTRSQSRKPNAIQKCITRINEWRRTRKLDIEAGKVSRSYTESWQKNEMETLMADEEDGLTIEEMAELLRQ